MVREPDLGQSADPRELVRGDGQAVQATVAHLVALADGFRTTAGGLRAIDTGAWTGPAATAFRARFAEAPTQWSGAAEAFGSAAQAWGRFGSALVAAQERAGAAAVRFQAGAAAALRARAIYAAEVQRYLDDLVTGRDPGPEPVLDASGTDEMGAARRMLADARALRNGAAACATRRIAEAAALAPDPPTGWDRRLAEAADWVGAQGIELAHVGQGVGEGVEGLVRLARTLNPADPYNLNHPARFVENASSALAGTVDTAAHPLRLATDVVGTGWGSDPSRAFGHLLPMAAGAASSAARSALGAAEAETARSALGAGEGGATRSLWSDPHPTSPPFTPHPDPPPPPNLPSGEVRPADLPPADVRHGAGPPADPRPSELRPTASPFTPHAESPPPAAVPPGDVPPADIRLADLHPTSPPFNPSSGPRPPTEVGPADLQPVRELSSRVGAGPRTSAGLGEADRGAAERFDRIGGDLQSRIDRLAPRDTGPAVPVCLGAGCTTAARRGAGSRLRGRTDVLGMPTTTRSGHGRPD